MSESEIKKSSRNTKYVRKCLDANYKKLSVNVKVDTMDEWKAYAESKGMSMYALVHEMFEKAMIADGFKTADPESKPEE